MALQKLGGASNAYTFRFDDRALDEARLAYSGVKKHLARSPRLFEGGALAGTMTSPPHDYYFKTYNATPLLWVSSDSDATHAMFQRCFDALDLAGETKKLIDCDRRIVTYSGFFVIGRVMELETWHVDYLEGANAFTLITPLFELHPSHGHLLYLDEKVHHGDVATCPKSGARKYHYKVSEGILFGDSFVHATEPYARAPETRVLLSITFGTDKMKYWHLLKESLASQAQYLVLPCGHRVGTCECGSPGRTRRRRR